MKCVVCGVQMIEDNKGRLSCFGCREAQELFIRTQRSIAQGSELFHKRILEYDYKDSDMHELQIRVWNTVPWMVDVFVGEYEGKEGELTNWCRKEIGRESSFIHGKKGLWRRGNVIIFGWTWFGFATEELMNRFVEKFPPEKS